MTYDTGAVFGRVSTINGLSKRLIACLTRVLEKLYEGAENSVTINRITRLTQEEGTPDQRPPKPIEIEKHVANLRPHYKTSITSNMP